MKDKKRLFIGVGILAFILIVVAVIATFSFAAPLENDVKVEEDSELTYYIDVIYDGKDGNAVTSSDSATAQVYSDYIYIEDRIPEGLTFKGFVQTDDGTIGAVKRSDGSFCAGYVVDGVSGLTYDAESRMVNFKVKNLQAGCKITVGIITQTPNLPSGVNRMDFYNTAYGREGNQSVASNTVHAYIGRDSVTTYNVTYQYSGDVPENAPALPPVASYTSGTSVGIVQDINIEGYEFSGWKIEGASPSIDGKSFIMPAKDVVLTGSFTKKEQKLEEVKYTISGVSPDGYLPPLDKSYPVGSDVKLDSLKLGDVINGYRFLGWKTSDVELPPLSTDESTVFTMPDNPVTLVGEFERISYKVTYKFQGAVIPPNADSLLPAEKEYYPGDKVTTAAFPETEGYRFLGWYYADEFKMPEEDVVIYGEWMVEAGVFAPTITKDIVDKQTSYQSGDKVKFNITVTNNEDYEITDVMLEEQTEGAVFVAGSGYEVRNDSYVFIPTISPHGSVTVSSEYTAGDDVVKEYTNVVELTGALADGNYILDTSKTYKAEAKFIVSNISLAINKVNEDGEELANSEFTLYRNAGLTSVVSKGLSFSGLSPGTTYYLKETKAPSGYQLLGKTLEVRVGADGNITIPGYEVTSQGGKYTVTIANQEINVLPNTGGVGIVPFVVAGLVLILAGLGFIIMKIRKGGDKHEKSNK